MSRYALIACCVILLPACKRIITPGIDLAGTDLAGTNLNARVAAVDNVIATDSDCTGIDNFYWEIGTVNGPLASGKVGTLYDSSTTMEIASASKFVWGAYVVEKYKADLSQVDFAAMSMQSGYTGLDYLSCVSASTVQDCLMKGNNGTQDPTAVGKFDYNGGHFQNYAVTLGLGPDDDAALTTEIKSQVGTELDFTYASPQLAAGINTSATGYAGFLRKILAGNLALQDQLGARAICTLPAACPTAIYSPSPLAWHYSYAHWVEDEPGTGDGAFSSPGAYGFYPWIDASKTYYGILARYSIAPNAYLQSALCGRAVRKAFLDAN